MGIANIHKMRESLDLLKGTFVYNAFGNNDSL